MSTITEQRVEPAAVRRAPRRRRAVIALAVLAVAVLGLSLYGLAAGGPAVPRNGAAFAGKGAVGMPGIAEPMPARVAPPLRAVAGSAGPAEAGVGIPAAPQLPAGAPDRVVKNATIALVVHKGRVTPTLTAAEQLAQAAGGYVQDSQSSEDATSPNGSVTIRVPVAAFDGLVARVRSLDATVRSTQVTGRDVSGDYADLQAQLVSLRAARSRFLDILAQTHTVEEVLSVQQRIDDVTGQINQVEGQRKLLASQSDLATLTVSVAQAGDPVLVPTPARSGLAEAWQEAKDGFLSGFEALVRDSGRFVLVLLCLLVLAVAGRLAWRRCRSWIM